MKVLITVTGIVLVVGGIVVNTPLFNKISYTAPQSPETIEKEVLVDNIAKRVQEAQEAAKAEIEAKAKAEYQAVFDAEMAQVKATVLKQIEGEIAAERKVAEQAVTSY